MKVFVTGASGWIGSAVVPELLGGGHTVVGLARSEDSAERLERAGAAVWEGDLDDPATLAEAAAGADGVIHLAFQHEVAFGGDFATAAAVDRRAVEAMGAALAGSDRPLVLASGLLGVAAGRVATEDDGLVASAAARAHPAARRHATALFTLSLSGVGVRSSVLRFPPTVHGDGDHGFVATLVATARQRGVAGYVADGANRWPAVHRSDAARLARLAVEAAPRAARCCTPSGTRGWHSVRSPVPSAGKLGVATASVSPADVAGHFGHLGMAVAVDCPASAAVTRELLGWHPSGPTLLEDLDQDHYDR